MGSRAGTILLVVLAFTNVYSCTQTPATEREQSPLPAPAKVVEAADSIWTGESGSLQINWTTKDLTFRGRESAVQSLFIPLATAGFHDFERSTKEDSAGSSAAPDCTYRRTFTLLSVVDTTIGFEDHLYASCAAEAHPTDAVRFTTADLSHAGGISYESADAGDVLTVPDGNIGKIVRLNELFPPQEVLEVLLKHPAIAKTGVSATTLSQLTDQLADHPLETRAPPCLADVPSDFLTRFILQRMDNGNVAVRVGLPGSGACHEARAEIDIVLRPPSAMRESLLKAGEKSAGFLMKDAAAVAHGQATLIEFKLGKGANH